MASLPCLTVQILFSPQAGGIAPIVRCLAPNNRRKIIEIALALVASVGHNY